MMPPAKQELKLIVPPQTLLRDCVVHDVQEYLEEGNPFETAEQQIWPTAMWGVANAKSLGDCNTDKKQLRLWVEQQKAIYEKK